MITITAHDTFLYWNGKGVQRAKQWRDRVLQRKGYGYLTIGQIFMAARERIILDLIKMNNIKIISKNLDGFSVL
jgi:hypothetical protein